MSTRLVIDGNAVYEIDEDCEACRRKKQMYPEEDANGEYENE